MLRATYTALHGTILLQKGDFLAFNEKLQDVFLLTNTVAQLLQYFLSCALGRKHNLLAEVFHA